MTPSSRTSPGQTLNVLAWIGQALGWRIEAHDLPFGATADMPLTTLKRFTVYLTDEKVAPLPPDIAAQVHGFLARCYGSALEKALDRAVTPERIKKWRTQYDLSEKEAATLIGVTAQTLKNYEKGKTRPRPRQLIRVFNVLAGRPPETPVDWTAVAALLAVGSGTSP